MTKREKDDDANYKERLEMMRQRKKEQRELIKQLLVEKAKLRKDFWI